jgi:imidazoleglycerol phosphate dehydratase HisB
MRHYRIGNAQRQTKEVNINVLINLDKSEDYKVNIKSENSEANIYLGHLKLFEHAYSLMYKHGHLSGSINANGDLPHHVLEDLAMTFGNALKNSLGEKPTVVRYSNFSGDFQGSHARCDIDLVSGRGYVYGLDTLKCINDNGLRGITQHTLESMAQAAEFDMSAILEKDGRIDDDHHLLEILFKGLGRIIYDSSRIENKYGNKTASSKGVIGSKDQGKLNI